MPTLGVLLIDLEAGRTDGKIFGYQDDDARLLPGRRPGPGAQPERHDL